MMLRLGEEGTASYSAPTRWQWWSFPQAAITLFTLIHKDPKWVLILRTNIQPIRDVTTSVCFFVFLSYRMTKFFRKIILKKKHDHEECLFTFTTKIFCFRYCQLKSRDYMGLEVCLVECFFYHNCLDEIFF